MDHSLIAVIADVHGNTWALDAVLANIRGRGIVRIINLGDTVYGSLDPAGTVERLINACEINIKGNQDRVIFDDSAEVQGSADHRFVTSQLSGAQLNWLERATPTAIVGDIFCCHGSPNSDETYLLEQVTARGVFLRDTASIQTDLHAVTQQVILCGHSHVARTVWLPSGQLVVNPGSVGIPAYSDSLPYPHAMEAGSPHARYAVLTREPRGWAVEHIAVPYPWDLAAACARRNGRDDRATWIESGRAQP